MTEHDDESAESDRRQPARREAVASTWRYVRAGLDVAGIAAEV